MIQMSLKQPTNANFMKVIFFGTPEFAAHILEALVQAKVTIAAIVTKPDKPQGRSLKMTPPAVKQLAERLLPDVPIFQPEKCSTPESIEQLKTIGADLYVVVAYGEILSQALLDVPKFGAINVHASLLPFYRGAAPIQRVIMNGERETGISIIRLVRKMDAGDVLYGEKIPITDDMDAGLLENALCMLGIRCLLHVLDDFKNDTIVATPQDHTKVSFAAKITTEECRLDFKKNARELSNLIRGVSPYPGAWCQIKIRNEIKRLKVFAAQVVSEQENNSLTVPCLDGYLKFKIIQLEGKPKMSVEEFLKGIPLSQISFS